MQSLTKNEEKKCFIFLMGEGYLQLQKIFKFKNLEKQYRFNKNVAFDNFLEGLTYFLNNGIIGVYNNKNYHCSFGLMLLEYFLTKFIEFAKKFLLVVNYKSEAIAKLRKMARNTLNKTV